MLNNLINGIKIKYRCYSLSSKILIKVASVFILGILIGRLLPRFEDINIYGTYVAYILMFLTSLFIYLDYKRTNYF